MGVYFKIMIFVTVGTQKFQFNRLLKKIDELVDGKIIKEQIICQSGYSTYLPKNYTSVKFMSSNEYEKCIKRCNILITHAGVGTILTAKRFNKTIIVVPRLEKFKEHVDNHQLQIATDFERKNLVCACNQIQDLDFKIEKAKNQDFDTYESNNLRFVSFLNNIINNS